MLKTDPAIATTSPRVVLGATATGAGARANWMSMEGQEVSGSPRYSLHAAHLSASTPAAQTAFSAA
jgi:hypothetical protein